MLKIRNSDRIQCRGDLSLLHDDWASAGNIWMFQSALNDFRLLASLILISLQHGSLRVTRHLTWWCRLPRMSIPANKAEAAWPFVTQPLKPTLCHLYHTLLIEGVTRPQDSRGKRRNPIFQWEEHERIFCHVWKPPISYFWYIDSWKCFCGLTRNPKTPPSSVSMGTMFSGPNNRLIS